MSLRRLRSFLASRRGMALVLVMVILAALMVVATPFTVSMMFHEKTTRTLIDQAHASYGAEAARNHAVAVLAAGHASAEAEKDAPPPFNSPASDSLAEIAVSLDDPELTKVLETGNPRGELLGLAVTDEQGKVNLRSAPPALVNRVRSLVGGHFADPRDCFTTHSSRDADWITPERIRTSFIAKKTTVTPGQKTTSTSSSGLALNDGTYYGIGTRVRIINGVDVSYASVVENDGNNIILDISLPDKYDLKNAVVEAMARHPVNLNTAQREVLVALFTGLEFTEDDPKKQPDTMTDKGVAFLVDRLVAKPLAGMDDFLATLDGVTKKDLISGKLVQSILYNAVNPNHRKLGGSGTMPFCFRSFDVYGIEAAGVRNNPAANQVARHAFYEVVEVAPRGTLGWSLASQRDFDEYLQYECGLATRAKIRTSLAAVGLRVSPFGNGMVTWPNTSFSGVAPDNSMSATDGDVRLYAQNDNRIQQAQHFQQFHEGFELKKQALTYEAKDSVGLVLPPPKPKSTPTISLGGVNYTLIPIGWTQPSGGVEMWVQPDALPATQTFLDLCYKEFEDHLWVKYDSGNLSVGCRDGGLEGGSAEVRYPIALQAGIWRHVAASWMNTKYGQLGLMLDGRPVGAFHYYDKTGKQIDALSGGVSDTDTTIPVSGGALPAAGAVQIGLEIVEYAANSGGLTGCTRGARGSTALVHAANTPVVPLGYSDPLAQVTINLPPPLNLQWDRIPVVKGANAKDFGIETSCDLFNPFNPRPPGGITAADPLIPVVRGGMTDATVGFPERGYLLITGDTGGGAPAAELVYYDSKIPNAFVCQNGRGQTILDIVTTAQAFHNGAKVHLFSIEVTDNTGYSANNGVAAFQMDDEWFLGRPFTDTKGTQYWTGLYLPINPQISFYITYGDVPLGMADLGFGIPGRYLYETSLEAHTAGAKVLPVFAVAYGFKPKGDDGNPGPPGVYQPAGVQYDYGLVGKNDLVTVVAADQITKELATVKNGRSVDLGGTVVQLAAFDRVLNRDYVADAQGGTRLLKFPSGEMLSFINAPVYVCEAAPASQKGGARMVGRVDELKFFAGKLVGSGLAADIAASTKIVTVIELGDATATDYSMQGGAVLVGDEMIGYTNYKIISETSAPNPLAPTQTLVQRVLELQNCARGYLNTKAAGHSVGDPTLKHFGMAVLALDKSIGATDAELKVPDTKGSNSGAASIPYFNGLAKDGYLLADDELIGYTELSQSIWMPRKANEEGMYRAAFGTKAANHSKDTLLCAMPFRYHDRWRESAFDDTMCYYEISRRATRALWQRVTWTSDIPDRKLALKVLVRIDGTPSWDTPPTNKPGGLYLFTDEKAKNLLDVRGDQIEVRFGFEFKKDCFVFTDLKEDAWKKSAVLRSVRVEYEQPVTSRYYETR